MNIVKLIIYVRYGRVVYDSLRECLLVWNSIKGYKIADIITSKTSYLLQ